MGKQSHVRKYQTGKIPMKEPLRIAPTAGPGSPGAYARDGAGRHTGPGARRHDFSSQPQPADSDSSDDDAAHLPGITSLPQGIEVVEHEIGRAVGQWILMVRCQCGKRWFELEAVDTATCPRCDRLVYVDALDTRRG